MTQRPMVLLFPSAAFFRAVEVGDLECGVGILTNLLKDFIAKRVEIIGGEYVLGRNLDVEACPAIKRLKTSGKSHEYCR